MKPQKLIKRLEVLAKDIESSKDRCNNIQLQTLYNDYNQRLLTFGLIVNYEVYKNRYDAALIKYEGEEHEM